MTWEYEVGVLRRTNEFSPSTQIFDQKTTITMSARLKVETVGLPMLPHPKTLWGVCRCGLHLPRRDRPRGRAQLQRHQEEMAKADGK